MVINVTRTRTLYLDLDLEAEQAGVFPLWPTGPTCASDNTAFALLVTEFFYSQFYQGSAFFCSRKLLSQLMGNKVRLPHWCLTWCFPSLLLSFFLVRVMTRMIISGCCKGCPKHLPSPNCIITCCGLWSVHHGWPRVVMLRGLTEIANADVSEGEYAYLLSYLTRERDLNFTIFSWLAHN